MNHTVHLAVTCLPESGITRTQEAARELGYEFSSYSSENDLISDLGHSPPDVIVMGIDVDCSRPLMLQRRLWNACEPTAVVYLSERPEVAAVVAAMQMGAVDVLRADCHSEDLRKAVREASLLSDTRLQWMSESRDARWRLDQLSARQFELMQHLLAGRTNHEIGLQLNLSTKTVEKHRVTIRSKTATTSLTELYRLYCVANRPLTAAYCLNEQEMLGFREAFDAPVTDV